ncbi:hypothetical protein CEXT_339601 [Caerostris extrusa]|uniref:Uncharacterized protein n=1 Tax=Caerostris extrusa TaxID=172846 RepID=A0AAV4NL03_CAEEX|nr:hypothetical protein CEXT_339601 [Caerostris extrusa]
MCEHDKLHIRNPTVNWTPTAYYATLGIHHHHLPSQFVKQNFHGSGPHFSVGSSSSGGSAVRSLVLSQGT